ncbi:MAG: ABC transporter substrate-binding protein [Rhodospirillaceae bacterium]|jgi:phospholipid transport system substrate-binding protein|nr:ABC transporter substrate-binding protein [Rhodospirillaceae bacterium]
MRRIPVVFFLVLMLAVYPARADDATVGAKTFIEALANEALQSLTAQDIDRVERRERVRKMMLDKFAFKRIARWVLGRYWRRATEAERDEYMKLFEDMLVIVYADRFANYAGEKLDVGRSETRGENDILVHSKLVRSEGEKSIDVAWRLSAQDNSYKIVDVMVEGLSMGITQQKEFSSVIRQNGNGVQGLLDELKKRIDANS